MEHYMFSSLLNPLSYSISLSLTHSISLSLSLSLIQEGCLLRWFSMFLTVLIGRLVAPPRRRSQLLQDKTFMINLSISQNENTVLKLSNFFIHSYSTRTNSKYLHSAIITITNINQSILVYCYAVRATELSW